MNNKVNDSLVSVVICTCDRADMLIRALDSVLKQTYKNIEIIVSDDFSSDNTPEVVADYMARFPGKIKYSRNESRCGACVTRNNGIKLADGEYITGLDDDDEFSDNRIQVFIENYEDDFSFICSDITVVTKRNKFKMFGGKKIISCGDLFLFNEVGNQVFIKTERLKFVEGFDEKLTSAQDLDLWVRLVRQYGFAKRIENPTYILHIEHDKPRITTSSRKVSGLYSFYNKHVHIMDMDMAEFYRLKIAYWEEGKKFNFRQLKYFRFSFLPFFFKHIYRKVRQYVS